MKHKKHEPTAGLRRRIESFTDASVKVNLENILSLQKETVPEKEANIRIEEIMFEGVPWLNCPSLSREAGERYLREFNEKIEKGMTGEMIIKQKPIIKGRTVAKDQFGGHDIYLAALISGGSTFTSFMLKGDEVRISTNEGVDEIPRSHVRNSLNAIGKTQKAVILDLVQTLEDAVVKVNFFRHKESDGNMPLLLVPDERRPSNATIRERLDWICPNEASTEDNRRALARLKQKIGPTYLKTFGTDLAVDYSFRSLKFDDKVVRATNMENDVEHVIALCNLLARSSAISAVASCLVSGRARAGRLHAVGLVEEEQKELFYELVGKVAELAYGGPYVRLADTSRKMITEGPSSTEGIFKQMGLHPVMSRLLLEELDATGDQELNFMYSRTEKDWGGTAASVLEELSKELGFSFHSIPGIIDTFEKINSTVFITRESLPLIAAIWQLMHKK